MRHKTHSIPVVVSTATNGGIHIVALLEMGIQVHWAVENVLSYSTSHDDAGNTRANRGLGLLFSIQVYLLSLEVGQ